MNLNDDEFFALQRFFARAESNQKTGCWVRQFLLSWHDAARFGGVNLVALREMPDHVQSDALALIRLIIHGPIGCTLEDYGYKQELEFITRVEYDHQRGACADP